MISAIFDGTFRSPSEDVRKRIAVRALQDNLIIRRVGLTDVLEVSFRSPDREKAAPIANAVAQAYVNDQLNTEYELARRAGTWWRARLSELREQASAGRLAETYKNDFEIAKQRNDDVQKEHDLAVAQAEQNNQAQAVAQAEQNNQAQAVTQAEQNNQSQVVLSDLESKSETYRALYDNFLQRDMDFSSAAVIPDRRRARHRAGDATIPRELPEDDTRRVARSPRWLMRRRGAFPCAAQSRRVRPCDLEEQLGEQFAVNNGADGERSFGGPYDAGHWGVSGLHVGKVFYGNVGSRERLDFTVLGPAVNEASRIAVMCRSVDQPVLISAAFADVGDIKRRLVSAGRYALRGVSHPQELFTIDTDSE